MPVSTTLSVGDAAAATILCGALVLGACGGAEDGGAAGPDLTCSIPTDRIYTGAGRDQIPALSDPTLVQAGTPATDYLAPGDRVIGVEIDGAPVAVPHNILWFHEIVNLDAGGRPAAVTYCPLTGSSLAFDRGPVDGARFGVSGLLYLNNLIMYDRTNRESFWPQMLRGARCGPRDGTKLPMYPVVEMTWRGWRELHPDTRVVSSATGHGLDYRARSYPYGNYELPDNPDLLFPMPRADGRRPPKERVLGIPSGNGGLAFPFFALDDDAPLRAVRADVDGDPVVVFWERARQAAVAHRPHAAGRTLTFAIEDAAFVDRETGSTWRVDGRAVAGPLAGERLEPVVDAFVAFWFAWAAFHPETRLWTPEPAAGE